MLGLLANNTTIIDSTRRSGRATKGQHSKLQEEAEAPAPTPPKRANSTKKSKKNDPTPPPDEEEEGDAIIRCICGYVEEDEDDERKMICCEQCEAWQHNECMEMSENDDELPDKYYCEQCRPKSHKELLAKIARGEKPWEERAKQQEEEEAQKKTRKKKGKKGGKRGRPSEVQKEETQENGAMDTTMDVTVDPAPETVQPKPLLVAEQTPTEVESNTNNVNNKRKYPEEAVQEAQSPSQAVSVDDTGLGGILNCNRSLPTRHAKPRPRPPKSHPCLRNHDESLVLLQPASVIRQEYNFKQSL